MTKEVVTPMISAECIDTRISELARAIEADFTGETLTVVCTLRGAVMFFSDLVKKLTIPIKMDFIEASSYGDGQSTSGVVKIHKDLTNPITGEHVLLVEDIIDSGVTLHQLVQHLQRQMPKSLKLCALLDKPSRRIIQGVNADYVGFEIPDEFVLGYGLDYQQRYRNLPYIASMKFVEIDE